VEQSYKILVGHYQDRCWISHW